MRFPWIPPVISGFFIIAVLYGLHVWLYQTLEYTPVVITANHSEENRLPFYAQFVVTEHFTMEEPAFVTRLEAEWHPPTVEVPVVIDLHRNGKLVSRWRVHTLGKGSVETLYLPLSPPELLDGLLEISFSAPEINHENAAAAPILFMEPFDGSFPNGNYRIANNEKVGDVSMRLVAERSRIEVIRQEMRFRPSRSWGMILGFVTAWFLVAALPYILLRDPKV